jgi:hypothetical protein
MTDNDIVTLAFRRVLAELTRDYEAWGVTADDVGACPHCWQRIAYELAQIHAGHLCMHHGSEDTPIAAQQHAFLRFLDKHRR